jgi:enamine deaminase RidA (YjgF/YER057c/UK114 family)
VAHEEIRSPKVFKSTAPFSLATRTTGTRLLHVSGQVARGLDGEVASKGDNSSGRSTGLGSGVSFSKER